MISQPVIDYNDKVGLYAADDNDDDDADNTRKEEDGDESESEEYDSDSRERNGYDWQDSDQEKGTRDGNDVDVGDLKTHQHVTHGFHSVEGNMGHRMGDFLVAKTRNMHSYELGLYAVFDGHSGREVAEYLRNNLFDNILSEPDFWTHPICAVKCAYRCADEDILVNVVGRRGGSTAVTAILINLSMLVVANVGDSRAVACRNGKAKHITVDHDPLKEKNLLQRKGGFVTQKRGYSLVVIQLEYSLAMYQLFVSVDCSYKRIDYQFCVFGSLETEILENNLRTLCSL